MLRVLIACESSGVSRRLWRSAGHAAWSCDLLPAEDGSPYHIQGDAIVALTMGWDLMIAHPPCTYLCASGMHWTTRGLRDPQLTEDALAFVRLLMNAPIPRIAIENPVGAIGSRIRPADCWVQPFEHGDDASKRTGLWLKNLPPLVPTTIVAPRMVNGRPRWANQTDSGQNRLGPSPDRWQVRSKTYDGIARAMVAQWSRHIESKLARVADTDIDGVFHE